MKHHIIGEQQQVLSCIYCGRGFDGKEEWRSQWHYNFHYKICNCPNCSKEASLKCPHNGSGHDDWVDMLRELIAESDEGNSDDNQQNAQPL